jgi:hypothetical protein
MVQVRFQFWHHASQPPSGRVTRGVIGHCPCRHARQQLRRTAQKCRRSDETEDVGEDLATPVTEDYREGDNKLTGTIDDPSGFIRAEMESSVRRYAGYPEVDQRQAV